MAHLAEAPPANADPQSLGRPIGIYGKSRSFLIVGGCLAALFIGVGLFVLWLTTRIGPDFRFDGDVALLYEVGVGALAIGAAVALLYWRLAASQPTFHLYEHGIRASGRGGDVVTLYRELEDLFMFFYGGIAYRAAPGAPWQFIASRIHRFGELSSLLRELQVVHRGELLGRRLDEGHPVVFRYFDDSVGRSKSAVASRNMNFPTHELVLTPDRLLIAHESIPLARIGSVDTNLWAETASIVDVDGKPFFRIHPSSILSFDLLHYLIARQQGNLAAQAAPVAAR